MSPKLWYLMEYQLLFYKLRCTFVLYQPLCYLFNLTLWFSYLPSDWKVHKIISIFKSGDLTSLKNFCPISLFTNASKVPEYVTDNKIIDHVSTLSSMPVWICHWMSLLFVHSAFSFYDQFNVMLVRCFDLVTHSYYYLNFITSTLQVAYGLVSN